MNRSAIAASLDDILPPEDLHQQYPHIPVRTIKWDAHERHRNGAAEAGCFVKFGKQLMVNVPAYLAWKLSQQA